MKRKIGIGFILLANALLIFIALSAPSYAQSHPHIDATLRAEYGTAWPVALICTLALIGIVLALIPIRRGERWAIWTSLASWIGLLATRLATDPRCLVVLDVHQHGCHTFMIAVLLGVVGLGLAAFGRGSV
jgi:hypothetical protein